jgi:hypothetical protein
MYYGTGNKFSNFFFLKEKQEAAERLNRQKSFSSGLEEKLHQIRSVFSGKNIVMEKQE